MTVVRPYYAPDSASAIHYDLVARADPMVDQDIAYYAGLATAGGSILELGAGTGRVAIPLAEQGFDVVGLDIAQSMLDQAEAKRAQLPAEVVARLRFVRGDLRSLALGQRFDLIVASYYTLAHVQPSAAWKQAFGGMARHLAPGGTIAVHLPDADQMRRPPPSRGQPVFRKPIDEGFLTLFVVDQTLNEKVGRFDLMLDYVVNAPDGREIRRSRERYSLFHADPAPFAVKAGLRPIGEPEPLGTTGCVHRFAKA
ncbi:MAG: class I SAM-dependent methyltransferase [Sphingomonadales bacterium]|nr:MAG: class I SAM-dependent methyltransferase [Sphingomonadales bacterium]